MKASEMKEEKKQNKKHRVTWLYDTDCFNITSFNTEIRLFNKLKMHVLFGQK